MQTQKGINIFCLSFVIFSFIHLFIIKVSGYGNDVRLMTSSVIPWKLKRTYYER